MFDETVTLTRSRIGSFEAANTVARRILGEEPMPSVFEVLTVGSADVRDALAAFRRYDDHDLSFTDATSVALCETRGIDTVLSFDTDFDGIVERVKPRS